MPLEAAQPDLPRIQVDRVIALWVGVAIALCLGMLWIKVNLPSPGFMATPADTGWRITALNADAFKTAALESADKSTPGGLNASWLGATVTRACAAAPTSTALPTPAAPKRCVDLQPTWVIDSPIMLQSASAQAEMIKGQQALNALGAQIVLHRADGPLASVQLEPGGLFLFDERMVMLLFVAIFIFTMGCALLVFVRRSPDAWLAFAMCSGFFLYIMARCWYTNRSWAQPEWQWWTALWAFTLGVLVCASACMALLWRLRFKQQHARWLGAVIAAVASVVFLHRAGVIDSVQWGYRLPTLGITLMIVATSLLIALRTLKTAGTNAEQASNKLASRTFAFLVLVGFTPMLIFAVIWNVKPELPQIGYINNLSVATAFLPLLVLVGRTGQYSLQRYWWTLWLVLIVCSLAILSAGTVALLLGTNATGAMLISVFIAAMAVYQLRMWLQDKILGHVPTLDAHLPALMRIASQAPDEANHAWRILLSQVFEPHSVSEVRLASSGLMARIQADSQGEVLLVPDIHDGAGSLLVGAARYSRHFYQSDTQVANTMLRLARQGQASKSSYDQGALQERKRIAADLHDDIGGKLLHLSNTPGADGQYARNTLEDLRTITRGLSAQTRSLGDLLADLQYQLAQRADRHGITFDWVTHMGAAETHAISSRQGTVLASICSELLRNAMQHPQTTAMQFDVGIVLTQGQATLQLRASNDGGLTDPDKWAPGLGTTSIRRRVHDLQGQCSWSAQAGGGVVFRAQWSLNEWLHSETGGFVPTP